MYTLDIFRLASVYLFFLVSEGKRVTFERKGAYSTYYLKKQYTTQHSSQVKKTTHTTILFMAAHVCFMWSRSGAPEITHSFGGVRVAYSLVFYVVSCVILFVCLSFFIFSHGVVSLFSIYEFDCPSGIFRPSFTQYFELFFCMENVYAISIQI